MVDDAVAQFLHFGYLPRLQRTPQVLARVMTACTGAPDDSNRPPREDQLVDAGVHALRSCFGDVDGAVHVVPLSGGLDSRAVLAGLVDRGRRGDVVAVTVGTPGTFDVDIARQVAARAGVRHEVIDLREVRLDQRSLVGALVASRAASWAFDVFFHRLIPHRFGHDATYWSGFMGGELAGSHVPAEPHESWSDAVRQFVAHGRFCATDVTARIGFTPERHLPQQPWCDGRIVPYGDQLDFGVRQDSYVRRTVLVEGYDYRTPFLTPGWVRFMLAVPPALRRGEQLFKRILTAAFPDLFSLPAKNTAGLGIDASPWRVTAKVRLMKVAQSLRQGTVVGDLRRRRLPVPFRMVNYVDFAAALQAKPDTRGLVQQLVRALDARGAVDWLNGAELWAAHERSGGDFDLACALTLLASLELNLRADSERETPLFGRDG